MSLRKVTLKVEKNLDSSEIFDTSSLWLESPGTEPAHPNPVKRYGHAEARMRQFTSINMYYITHLKRNGHTLLIVNMQIYNVCSCTN